jgi:hypothetical protein
LVESHKLDPLPFDEGPKPKSDELRLNIDGTILEVAPFWRENQLVQTQKKKSS